MGTGAGGRGFVRFGVQCTDDCVHEAVRRGFTRCGRHRQAPAFCLGSRCFSDRHEPAGPQRGELGGNAARSACLLYTSRCV
ncbi:hypothetical protein [Arthrobacter sp. KBS0703]|uniref:hypothetical protein n=1 Tax=Arthrobacter sp. KBS0703 TaxID=1955698 RepID=UPI0037C11A21